MPKIMKRNFQPKFKFRNSWNQTEITLFIFQITVKNSSPNQKKNPV